MAASELLAELDSVAWQSLTHAYGAATDVPGLVRSLALADDDAAVTDAEHKLWCAVLHQGNVFPATAPTLPFVIGLLRDRPELRPILVDWLTDLCWVFDHPVDSGPVAECRAVLVDGLDGLAELANDPRVEVRCTAAGFLGSCVPRAQQCWQWVHARLDVEHDPDVLADLIISLTQLARAAGSDYQARTRDQLDDWWRSDDPARKCVAAQARCLLTPTDPEPWPILLGFLPSGQPLGRWWGAGTPTGIVDALAPTDGALHTAQALDVVLRCIAGPSDYQGGQILRTLLAHVFPDGRTQVPRAAAGLDQRQRQVIDFLASGRVVFVERRGRAAIHKITQAPLQDYLLPSDVPQLRDWLAGADLADCVVPRLRSLVEEGAG